MPLDRPRPSGDLNFGEPVEPREAATVVVVRGGDEALEVLLVQRNPEARFMGGVWVFPGGSVDAGETVAEAAVREVAEEVAVELPGPDALVPLARWITPARYPMRFDTHFFLSHLPEGAEPRADGSEMVDLRWYAPQAALDASVREELDIVRPTYTTLEQLSRFATAAAALEWAAGRAVVPVTPQVVVEDDVARVVMPGDPGYV